MKSKRFSLAISVGNEGLNNVRSTAQALREVFGAEILAFGYEKNQPLVRITFIDREQRIDDIVDTISGTYRRLDEKDFVKNPKRYIIYPVVVEFDVTNAVQLVTNFGGELLGVDKQITTWSVTFLDTQGRVDLLRKQLFKKAVVREYHGTTIKTLLFSSFALTLQSVAQGVFSEQDLAGALFYLNMPQKIAFDKTYVLKRLIDAPAEYDLLVAALKKGAERNRVLWTRNQSTIELNNFIQQSGFNSISPTATNLPDVYRGEHPQIEFIY